MTTMNFRTLLKSKIYPAYKLGGLSSVVDRVRLTVNRSLHREKIPYPRGTLYIETSSICNLKCKFCAYEKKSGPRIIMSNEFFKRIVNEATGMGFNRFGLTPITGDVFFDKNFMDKLSFLDDHPGVKAYHFYTNFILPDHQTIALLLTKKKLIHLDVSLYGHDLSSFMKITKSNENSYDRLKSNLEYVLDFGEDVRRVRFALAWRTYDSFRGIDSTESDICTIVRELQRRYSIPIQVNKFYDNWGGYITREDVADLDIKILQEDRVYKNGACSLIFSKNQVMADGVVNACACRDVDATLALGDLKRMPLSEILTYDNAIYRNLIDNQQAGRFNPICRSCTFYRSIYKRPRQGIRLPEFLIKITSSSASVSDNV